MQRRRRWLVAALGTVLAWLFLVFALAGAGRSSFALQLTPPARAYLPLVPRHPAATPAATPLPPDDLSMEQSVTVLYLLRSVPVR